MKNVTKSIEDTFIAGLIFLLPLLILFVLVTKVLMFFQNFTGKIAAMFGIKSIVGISASSIVGTLSLVLLCFFCGYLIRVALFKHFSEWVDGKLRKTIPGYEVYREMAMAKLEKKEETLPYEGAAWATVGDGRAPAFIMETCSDGSLVIFIPSAGNTKEGVVLLMEENKVLRCPDIEMRQFKIAISNLGLGLSQLRK